MNTVKTKKTTSAINLSKAIRISLFLLTILWVLYIVIILNRYKEKISSDEFVSKRGNPVLHDEALKDVVNVLEEASQRQFSKEVKVSHEDTKHAKKDMSQDIFEINAIFTSSLDSDLSTANTIRQRRAKKVKARFQPLSSSENNALAGKAVEDYLPNGDYSRLLLDSQFYTENYKFFYRFRSLKEIADYQKQIEKKFQSKFVADNHLPGEEDLQFFSLRSGSPTKTRKGDIKISTRTIGKGSDKKSSRSIEAISFGNPNRGKHIFIVSSLRGCERVTPLALLHATTTLLGRTTTQDLLQAVQFHIVPVANPDGYDFSRKSAKGQHWCKNRRLIQSTQSHGVDLSKNFGLPPLLQDQIKKSLLKTTKKKKKVVDYRQIYNFSEPETVAIRDFIDSYNTGPGSTAVINLRCCSGEIVPPKLFKSRELKVHPETIASIFANLIPSEGVKYSIVERDDSFDKKYAGSLIDWAHSIRTIDHAYEINLKASGLTTRTNHNLISEEPFVLLSRQLERTLVLIAQLLLSQEIE